MRAGWRVNAPNYSQLASPQLKVAVPHQGLLCTCLSPLIINAFILPFLYPRCSLVFIHSPIAVRMSSCAFPHPSVPCPRMHSLAPCLSHSFHKCLLPCMVPGSGWRTGSTERAGFRSLQSGREVSHRENHSQARGKGLVPCDRAWSIRKAGRAPRSRHLAALGWRSEGSLIVR